MQEDAGVGLLRWCLGNDSGYTAIGSKHYRTGAWRDTIFRYPEDIEAITEHVKKTSRTHDVYFCPTILRKPRRKKINISLSNVAWADLDLCPPDKLLVPPTVVVETSKNRHHGYWKFNAPESALEVEEINRRIAYFHAEDGCDKAGADLTQYLRIPGTTNFKYIETSPDPVVVKVVQRNYENKYSINDFDIYPKLQDRIIIPIPPIPPDITASDILDSIVGQTRLHASARELFETEPEGEWSGKLWNLEQLLLGAGFTEEETFIVCREAACNKYARDNRPDDHLWEDICRAKAAHEAQTLAPSIFDSTVEPEGVYIPRKDLLTPEERTLVRQRKTFIEEYVEWAKEGTDAPVQYHEAGAFIILSGILAGTVRVPTSAGIIKPNLWFMTLGETTISRKTTCMNVAMSVLEDIDPEVVLATDGSVEGVLSAISTRPNRTSIYHKDEFSGLLDAMARKDYLSGAMEHFTQLYDSQHLKRTLRAEVIDIRNPIFILYAGGIRERMYTFMSYDHIDSGFAPRFIFVSPRVQLTNQKPMGPPVRLNIERRAEIVSRLQGIYNHYEIGQPQDNNNNNTTNGHVVLAKTWNAELEPEAWVAYNKFEYTMHKMAFESDVKDLMMPMMDRLAKSGLKMSVLIAAAERLNDKIVVTKMDVLHAFNYIENYMEYSIEVVSNAGKSSNEVLIEKIVTYTEESGSALRSTLMRKFHLSSRQAEGIFDTIEQRGLLGKSKVASGFAYHPSRHTEERELELERERERERERQRDAEINFGAVPPYKNHS